MYGSDTRLRLDGDAALALDRIGVEHLGFHLARLEAAADLDDAVGKRGLAVVDVGDDGKVADVLHGGGTRPSGDVNTALSHSAPVAARPEQAGRGRCRPDASGGRYGHQPGAFGVAHQQTNAIAGFDAFERALELGNAANGVLPTCRITSPGEIPAWRAARLATRLMRTPSPGLQAQLAASRRVQVADHDAERIQVRGRSRRRLRAGLLGLPATPSSRVVNTTTTSSGLPSRNSFTLARLPGGMAPTSGGSSEEADDLLAVEGEDHVAGADARLGGGAVVLHGADEGAAGTGQAQFGHLLALDVAAPARRAGRG